MRRPLRRLMALLQRALAGAVLAWLAGFAWFVLDASRPPGPPPHADAIVVLTGGADRVPTALRLLQDGAAPRLLLSGVARGVELREVGRAAGIGTDDLAARITLGHAAEDTRGNAGETAAWVASQGVRSLLVVTAGYHMRRALLEMRRALPGVALYPVPVRISGAPTGARVNARLYAAEFTKLLIAAAQPVGSLQGGLWGMWTTLWGPPSERSPASAANPCNILIKLFIFPRERASPPRCGLWG